ncbi:hypothetical protein BKA64DRAFT_658746 [Cadophora sp. MPI-SDFR-AT-0126]|nr:hypothetical protein BKA64DRAFT_658746 [Leotiomycetes sp. MPI-SDFR-AT-0126]
MRFFGQDIPDDVLHGYLTAPLSPETVAAVQSDFASTATKLRLAIHDKPEFYNLSAEEIRQALEAQAQDQAVDDFVLIGADVAETSAIWYIGQWVSGEDYEDGIVERRENPIVWRMRTMVKATPSRWTDYSIANSSIQEDIDATVESIPWDPEAPARPFGEDEYPRDGAVDDDQSRVTIPFRAPAYVIAEPGEWEEGPGNLMNVDPPQERVYRLKKEIADQHGLRNEWAIGWHERDTPEGSLCFAQSYL